MLAVKLRTIYHVQYSILKQQQQGPEAYDYQSLGLD